MASNSSEKLHFVLIPLPAQGHMIPMIDMAKLLAQHGVVTSLVTTPQNAARFAPTIHRAAGTHIRLIEIPFPSNDVGLPPGCENLDSVPSRDLLRKFYAALDKLHRPLEQHLLQQNPPPSCIISDKCLSWTSKLADRFKIPRIVFHGTSCFSLLSSHNVRLHKPHMSVASDYEPFLIPGMPVTVRIAKAHLPGSFLALPDLDVDDIREQMHEAELNAYGVVMNTFSELECGCVEEYRKAINKKVWCIGPVSLCNDETVDKFERGNRASIDEKTCLEWLNSMIPKSVIYACLGSQCRLVPKQLIELGLGLEASNRPFIWVIKRGERFEEMEKWLLEERYEERIKGRGLLIKGWAPQVLILSHDAIGGFLTHCGWNSTIEGVCSGIPMITWPMFAEQFLNEKLVVEILRIGVRVGVELPVRWGEEESVGVAVVREQVVSAVEALMGGGDEGEKRRIDARDLKVVAMSKMEDGGAARFDISVLIQDIMAQTLLRRDQL